MLRYSTTVGMESTYNDGGSAFTSVPIFNTGIPKFLAEEEQIQNLTGSLGQSLSYVSLTAVEFPIEFYLKGNDTAGTAPDTDKIWRTFGLTPTNTPATSQTYKVRDSGHESSVFKINIDGVEYKVGGCRGGKLKLALKAGKRPVCSGTVRGLYNTPSVVSYVAPSSLDTSAAQQVVSMALTVGGTSYSIPEFNLNLDNETVDLESINAANNGIESVEMAKRIFTGDFLVQRNTSNDVEFFTTMTGSTEVALASTGFGSANIVGISSSNMQFKDVQIENYKDKVYYRVKFSINYNATAASEFLLSFT